MVTGNHGRRSRATGTRPLPHIFLKGVLAPQLFDTGVPIWLARACRYLIDVFYNIRMSFPTNLEVLFKFSQPEPWWAEAAGADPGGTGPMPPSVPPKKYKGKGREKMVKRGKKEEREKRKYPWWVKDVPCHNYVLIIIIIYCVSILELLLCYQSTSLID